MADNIKKIIHIDMDAFYASVEQRDNAELKGKPVIVGGKPDSRGVVAACSYEARKFGIHSAMPSSRAVKLCPHAVFLRPRFDAYKKVSYEIREIFFEYTDLVEPMSLDEAYLDVTENKINNPSATIIAREIKSEILKKTKLTASAGISFNKFLAKMASEYHKPDGLTVVTPDLADDFIDRLPVGNFHGIGKVTEKKLINLGIKTGKDLKKINKYELVKLFGKAGEYYYKISHGDDDRAVNPNRVRKSIGKETTLKEDISDIQMMIEILNKIACQIEDLLKKYNTKGRTITLKVKFYNFDTVTRSITIDEPITGADLIIEHVKNLLNKTEVAKKKVRLLGITISNFETHDNDLADNDQLMLPLY